MNNYLKQALNLARRTGDRVIVYDSAKNERPMVIMDIDSYEEMFDEFSGLDEEGPDDFDFNSEFDFEDVDSDLEPFIDAPDKPMVDIDRPITDLDDFENCIEPLPEFAESNNNGTDTGFDPDTVEEKKKRPNWSIPRDRKAAATEVLNDEDLQYLEEIRH